MRTESALRWSMLALVSFLPAFACAQSSPSPDESATSHVQASGRTDVLVTVNGVPIGKADVALRLKSESHDTPNSGDAVEKTKNVLEGIIRQEVASQKAIALGLEKDPKYQESLRQLEAQINAFKRKELSDAYYRHEVEKKGEVTDAEAKKFFDENAARIRTQLKVSQILLRSEAAIEKAQHDLDAGASFDDVAQPYFPKVAAGAQKPWDLGYLSWHQVPPAWRSSVYDLPAGQNSQIIRGPSGRYWIVRVVDRREDADVPFDTVKGAIKNDLKSGKIEQLREQVERELLDKAHVVYSAPVPAEVEE